MKTRFCPSPTGFVHLGNIRTALFNVLLATKMQGTFLLRIEDTDRARSKDEYTNAMKEDLLWLGLPWQEGPDVGGNAGPYWQSQRQAIYDKYYEILEKEKLVYPCFCTEEQLMIHRKVSLSRGIAPRYSGTCCNLTEQQIQEKRAQGQAASLRFRIPKGQIIEFVDLVKGEQKFNSDDIGDFIVRRQDGTPPFMFCNAIDDALMGVTHAIRGEDHLTNTPKQLLILKAVQLTAPSYGHVSLILGKDGSPLSKRNGSRSVRDCRADGYLPIAVVNYLSRLGHYYENHQFMTLPELAKNFALTNLSLSPARFDADHLLHWQKEAVSRLSEVEFWDWCAAALPVKVPEPQKSLFVATVKPNAVFPSDVAEWASAIYDEKLTFSDEHKKILQEAGKLFFETALQELKNDDFKQLAQALTAKLQVKGKALFQPLRIALMNKAHGPEMGPVCQLMGVEKIRQRLNDALNQV